MSNNFLSQDEINALLSGDSAESEEGTSQANQSEVISETDKDLLGEVGNISMGSASTALYQLINQQVNITTPVVSVTTLREIKEGFEIPNILLDIKYIKGIVGRNILIINIRDGQVIANLMMGGDGNVGDVTELSEIEISAVSEAMNQMIGSAATSMATMFGRAIDISPPVSKVIKHDDEVMVKEIGEDEPIVKVSFRLTIGDIVDSNIMQVFPIETAKNIVGIMTGEDNEEQAEVSNNPASKMEDIPMNRQVTMEQPIMQNSVNYNQASTAQNINQPVEVHKAQFEPLAPQGNVPPIKNIDLILDVPLNISVVLGRTKKSIQDILNLGAGSLIELEKLAEEPVEILVNGKQIALGEVVVVDENFGVRITNIVNGMERLKSLR